MSKHAHAIQAIRQSIRTRRLKPGDPLPSERTLARQFGVSYGAVRMANDVLSREGLVERRHGQGTFVAGPASKSFGSSRKRRLGLLSIDVGRIASPYSQHLAFAIQSCAHRLGYELTIEQMYTEDLMVGQMPEMIRRRSVDAVILDGRVTDAHLRFFERHAILYVVTGTLPLGPEVPQVRANIYDLSRQITRQFLEASYGPIWLDADPNRAKEEYFVGSERLRGYMDEIQQSRQGNGSLYLCPITAERVETIVDRLAASDLSRAACIVENWAWPLVAESLVIRNPQAEQALFVPLPSSYVMRLGARCRRLHWRHASSREWIARPAVEKLMGVLEEKQAFFQSVSIDMPCSFDWTHDPPEADLLYAEVPYGPRFVAEFHAGGAAWRMEAGEAQDRDLPAATALSEPSSLGVPDPAGE